MKLSLLLAAAATTARSAAIGRATEPATGDGVLSHFANSFISRGAKQDFHYTTATLYLGIEGALALSRNESIATWLKSQMDAIVLENGTIANWRYDYHSLDDYRMGNQYLYWYERTGEERFKSAADIVRRQLNQHPRTPSGGFWHREPTYPNQMWLDGIFMADSFYAQWTQRFDAANATAWDDIALQFDLIEEHTRNTTSGLLAHGYDESKTAVWADPVTGAAPLVWDRAVGWYFLSLLETLAVFPAEHPGHARLTEYFTTLAAALKKAQDPATGGFWLIMNEPYAGAPGNYIESSATAMFTAGWLQGIRAGLLDKAEYLGVAQKAYDLILDRFVKENADGTLNWEGTVEVGSLSSNGSYEVRRVPFFSPDPRGTNAYSRKQYYINVPLASNDFKGAGPFMLAAFEMESWAAKC